MKTKKKALIIENDPAILEAASLAVADFGYETFSASNRDFAIPVIMAERPDLILLDYHLPGMDFSDFMRLMAASFPSFRLAIFTTDDARSIASNFGLKNRIQKPFYCETLKSPLAGCLNDESDSNTDHLRYF